jgi:hypothetical protein
MAEKDLIRIQFSGRPGNLNATYRVIDPVPGQRPSFICGES